MEKYWTNPLAFRGRNTAEPGYAHVTRLLRTLILASWGFSGCISYTSHDFSEKKVITTTNNRPACVASLANKLRNVRHAQPIVGVFLGVSNYSEKSRLWSTPAHTISAAMFREPFYLTAGSDASRNDLRLVTDLRLDPKTELARSTEYTLREIDGISSVVNDYSESEDSGSNQEITWSYIRDAEPTTRKNLLDKTLDALGRAEEMAQKNGSVVFIFYISAHGWIGADGRSYVLPSDADFNIPTTWIDQQEILELTGKFLSRSKSDGLNRKAIVVFDTCRSARGVLPDRLAVGASKALQNAFVVETTSPGSYAWHWTMNTETKGNIEVTSESRWGFPLPPPKAKRGPIESRLSANMSVAPMASSCAISEFFENLANKNPPSDAAEASDATATSAPQHAQSVMTASDWLLPSSHILEELTGSIPEVKESGETQYMQVSAPSNLDSIPLLKVTATSGTSR